MCDQTNTFARCNVQFPIGTILMYWGDPQALQDTGWAVCDGKPPEPGWNEQTPAPVIPITPNLVASIPVGTERASSCMGETEQKKFVVVGQTEPHSHALNSFHDPWQGLRAQSWEIVENEGKFYERPYVRTENEVADVAAGGMIEADHLPGQKVYFIIKYKHVY